MPINPPHTIDGVRQALPAERREEFMASIASAPHTMLPVLVDDWRAMAVALSLPYFEEAMTEAVDVETAPDAGEYRDQSAA